ncbi:MAG: DUF86 domain-containing protein [Actinobacteria bacterium]|nr:DUF86 domain-containing protein [Actinomycetota bacterium]
MQREPRAFVEDILISCDAIAADVAGVDVESYLATRIIRSAVEREFMIIGEAINYLGDVAPDLFVRITQGRTIVDFRNQLAHGYMTVNDRLVWGYAVREAPLLRDERARLLTEIEGEDADW